MKRRIVLAMSLALMTAPPVMAQTTLNSTSGSSSNSTAIGQGGGSSIVGVDAGSNSTAQSASLGNSITMNSSNPRQAPTAAAPGLAAAGIELCLGSASGGFSGPGFGISFGGTQIDEGCEARLDARTLYSLGQPTAALYRMCARPAVAEALYYAGYQCPEAYIPRAVSSVASAIVPGSTTRTGGIVVPVVESGPMRGLPILTADQARRMNGGRAVLSVSSSN